MTADTTLKLTAQEATNADFWRELCPGLSIGADTVAPPAQLADIERQAEWLRHEGYINEPGVLPLEFVRALHAGIERLAARGIPPAFIYLYDEPWLAFRALTPFLARVLGPDFRLMAGVWAWLVQPSEDDAGWKPHRDGFSASAPQGKLPDAVTIWLPLTDATCLNGCIYIVPSHWDDAAAQPVEGDVTLTGRALQNIRALPAPAGSMLGWNHNVLHWGARASSRADGPRCSLALMFRRIEEGPEDPSWIRLHTAPSFHRRLGLIGHYVRLYPQRFGLDRLKQPQLQALAAALEWKYWQPMAPKSSGDHAH